MKERETVKFIREWGNELTGYKFGEELNIQLVKGIEQGYSDYAEVRAEKRKELHVSGAYAWVKGNHIEDQVARELQVMGIDFKKEKAGYSWEYLSFAEPKEKYLFLIRNISIIKGKSTNPTLDITNPENYLVEKSKINTEVDFDELKGSKQGTFKFVDLPFIPLSTDDESIEKLKKEYKHFYILTYSIQPETQMLMSIDLWMPEFISNHKVDMIQIDSLTGYIGQTGADVNIGAISELVHVAEEGFSGATPAFEFTSFEEVAEETSGTPAEHGIEQNKEKKKKTRKFY